jgi:ribonuclease BN (tRNA processing enzyme)
MSLELHILGSGGGVPSGIRETACYLVRDGERALLLDIGTGARRLITNPSLLDGVRDLHVVLTHFHLDHICGLPYLRTVDIEATIWAPGRWLYDKEAEAILEPVRRPPIAPSDHTQFYPVRELQEGLQSIAGFDIRTSTQPHHWSPSAGLRIDDEIALLTDTPYEPSSAHLAQGVTHLLHEAWSFSREPIYPEHDATAADAARVAQEADVGGLILIHLNPTLPDQAPVLADAAEIFERVRLAEDELVVRGQG